MTIEEAVGLAIKNIKREGLTDIFRRPSELGYLDNSSIVERILNDIIANLKKHHFNHLKVEPICHILVPKSRLQYDYRRAALISPCCTISYLALTLLAAPVIEGKRIPLHRKTVFSYRFAPNGDMLFSDEGGYNKWKEEIVRRREDETCNVVVKCDLASFYDRINLHRLESTLNVIGVETWISSTLDTLLKFWSKYDSYGLPVGSNASRILAEAVLIDIDNYLQAENIKYVRFVDDFRLFAPDLMTAQKWLGMLTSRLFQDGLLLNASKTMFYPSRLAEAEKDIKQVEAEKILVDFIQKTGKYRTVPRIYKKPSEEKFNAFKKVNIESEIKRFNESVLIEFSDVQIILIAILAQQAFTHLEKIDLFIQRCVYGLDYIVDMLEKNANDIPVQIRDIIKVKFESLLDTGFFRHLDWYEYRIICLLGSNAFLSKNALIKYIRNATKDTSPLGPLTALELLYDRLERSDVMLIREWYDKSGEWERRRIMRLVSSVLPEEEAKAWFRAIRPTISSSYLTEVAFDIHKK
jgi:hypothetical protein